MYASVRPPRASGLRPAARFPSVLDSARVRIAVSGTHSSGKTTLIEDFLAAHREYIHEPEPYVWLEELYGEPLPAEPRAADFFRQLEISVERLRGYERGACMIAERSPLDFIAYLLALQDLGRGDSAVLGEALALAADGLAHLDALVVLPLNEGDAMEVPEDEDPELREAMNDRLIELVEGGAFGPLARGPLRVAELQGTQHRRLAGLEQFLLDE